MKIEYIKMTLNEAIEHAKEIAKTSCGDCAKEHGQLVGWLEELVAFKLVAPTPADVRPVVRGKWTLHDDGSGTCSECGIRQMLVWNDDSWMNYCGNCGADMRGR